MPGFNSRAAFYDVSQAQIAAVSGSFYERCSRVRERTLDCMTVDQDGTAFFFTMDSVLWAFKSNGACVYGEHLESFGIASIHRLFCNQGTLHGIGIDMQGRDSAFSFHARGGLAFIFAFLVDDPTALTANLEELFIVTGCLTQDSSSISVHDANDGTVLKKVCLLHFVLSMTIDVNGLLVAATGSKDTEQIAWYSLEPVIKAAEYFTGIHELRLRGHELIALQSSGKILHITHSRYTHTPSSPRAGGPRTP